MDPKNASKPTQKTTSRNKETSLTVCDSESSAIPEENALVDVSSESASTAEFSQNSNMESAALPKIGAKATLMSILGQGLVAKKIPAGTSRESLHASAQEVIKEVNAKRKQDTRILADFKKALDLHANKTCNGIESQMFHTYETQGKLIQSKLQELFATLDRIAQLETELHEFKLALQVLYQEMQHGD